MSIPKMILMKNLILEVMTKQSLLSIVDSKSHIHACKPALGKRDKQELPWAAGGASPVWGPPPVFQLSHLPKYFSCA